MQSCAGTPLSEIKTGEFFYHKSERYLKVSSSLFNNNNAININKACLPRFIPIHTIVFKEIVPSSNI